MLIGRVLQVRIMPKFRIVFDRNKCIGAYTCVSEDGDKWKPADDGKVDLDKGKEGAPKIFTREIGEEELEKARAAASVCPAAAIEVVEEN